MKNLKVILVLLIGIIIGGAIGIKASELISSSQVIYKENQTVENSLNNLFDELKLGKDKIAEAITNKGVETTSDNTLEEMASNIDNLPTTDSNRKYYYKKGDQSFRDNITTTLCTNCKVTFNEDNVSIYTYGNGVATLNNVDVTDINYLYIETLSNTYTRGISLNGTSIGYWGGKIIDVSEYTGEITVSFSYNGATTDIVNMYGTVELE